MTLDVAAGRIEASLPVKALLSVSLSTSAG